MKTPFGPFSASICSQEGHSTIQQDVETISRTRSRRRGDSKLILQFERLLNLASQKNNNNHFHIGGQRSQQEDGFTAERREQRAQEAVWPALNNALVCHTWTEFVGQISMKGRRGCRRGRRHAGQTDRMLGVTLTSPRMGMKDSGRTEGVGGG